MLNMVNNGDPVAKLIGSDKNDKFEQRLRQEAPPIHVEILWQKLLLKKGLLKLILNQKDFAKEHLLKSLNSGHYYDARVRRECVKQLN